MVHIVLGNGLLPDSTKPLHEPMLIYHQRCSVAFTWIGQDLTESVFMLNRNREIVNHWPWQSVGHHWLMKWLVDYSMRSHTLNNGNLVPQNAKLSREELHCKTSKLIECVKTSWHGKLSASQAFVRENLRQRVSNAELWFFGLIWASC